MFLIGTRVLLGYTETIIAAILDIFPRFWRVRFLIAPLVCLLLCGSSVIFTTNGGMDLINLLDMHLYVNFFLIVLSMVLGVAWLYGAASFVYTRSSMFRFKDDLSIMLGGKGCHFVPWVVCWPFWAISWLFVTPFALYIIWGLHWKDYNSYLVETLSPTAMCVGLAIAVFPLFLIGITPVLLLLVHCTCLRKSCKASFEYLLKPSVWWGPAQSKYRSRMSKYLLEGQFLIDPSRTTPLNSSQPA
jgi:hypothetical protein